jgi:hypothetical protein
MTYTVYRSRSFDHDAEDFARYAADYSESFAREQFADLEKNLSADLAQSPNAWAYFFVTGAPYRARLFKVGRRTAYWIVYTVNDELKCVNLLRLWNASRDTDAFTADR